MCTVLEGLRTCSSFIYFVFPQLAPHLPHSMGESTHAIGVDTLKMCMTYLPDSLVHGCVCYMYMVAIETFTYMDVTKVYYGTLCTQGKVNCVHWESISMG